MPVQEPIHSLQNPLVKRLVRLRSRRERDAQSVWLIEGARELERADQAGVRLLHLFTCTELLSTDAARVRPVLERQEGVDHTELSRPAFEKVSGRENPDGLLALAVPPSPALPVPGEQTTVLLLLGLEKPGNLGALLPDRSGFAPVTGSVKGAVAVGSTPAEFAAFIAKERERWKPVIARAKVKPD